MDWFNTQRLFGASRDVPPAEFGAQYYAQAGGELIQRIRSPTIPVRFSFVTAALDFNTVSGTST